MEGQEGIPISSASKKRERIKRKSPQELAAQLLSVYNPFLIHPKYPKWERLNSEFKKIRDYIEGLLKNGVSDERLGEELGRLYELGKKLGIYSPLESKNNFLSHFKEYYLGLGYSETEAELEAQKALSRQGYLAELREWRRYYERDIRRYFRDFINRHPMSEIDEAERIKQLRERVIYLTDSEQTKELAVQFPGGNFLYHGTRVEQAIGILESGNLLNMKALLNAEEERVKREGGEGSTVTIRHNSGYEGISWSFNEIIALPGNRYHLVGFLASPQEVLTKDQQLAVPSRPAPHELIQIDGKIDSREYYEFKTQQELLNQRGIGEINSVFSNIVQLLLYRENQAKGSDNPFAMDSQLQNFVNRKFDDTEMISKLRGLYSLRENNTIELSPDLLQQPSNEIPVAAVWFQALIDTGRIKNVQGFEDVTTVREVIERINQENYKALIKELKREKQYLEDVIKDEDNKVTSLSVPVSQMYLVVPDIDLEKYLRVIARCGVQPKGIIVYPHMVVRLENFASVHRGDHGGLTQLIRNAIPPSEGYIDYEQILGTEITSGKLAGYRKHVIGDRYLNKRRSLRKDEQGRLFIS